MYFACTQSTLPKNSPKSVRNYLSAVKLYHNLLSVTPTHLNNFQFLLMLWALPLTMRQAPLQRLPMLPSLLSQICSVCDLLGSTGLVAKCGFLLAFFGFLRQSNLAPSCPSVFDVTLHTCRGDVFVQAAGLVITLKWTKTLQTAGQPAVIPVPSIPGHALDPVSAYQSMVTYIPTLHPSEPLLLLRNRRLMTSQHLRHILQSILAALGQPVRLYSLHSLRRGGATASPRAGVDYINIKRHGTWRSDSFWDYIAHHAPEDSAVARALADSALRV